MHRTWAIIERELRRFKRSPLLIVMSLIFPLVQLIVLGYAFGGNVKNLTIAVVDQDGGVPAVRVRELAGAVAANAKTFSTVVYPNEGAALDDLRNGRVNGIFNPDLRARAGQPQAARRSRTTPTTSSRRRWRRRLADWCRGSTKPLRSAFVDAA